MRGGTIRYHLYGGEFPTHSPGGGLAVSSHTRLWRGDNDMHLVGILRRTRLAATPTSFPGRGVAEFELSEHLSIFSAPMIDDGI